MRVSAKFQSKESNTAILLAIILRARVKEIKNQLARVLQLEIIFNFFTGYYDDGGMYIDDPRDAGWFSTIAASRHPGSEPKIVQVVFL